MLRAHRLPLAEFGAPQHLAGVRSYGPTAPGGGGTRLCAPKGCAEVRTVIRRTERAACRGPGPSGPRPLSSYEPPRKAAESLAACGLRSLRVPLSALAISPAETPESRASRWRLRPFANLRFFSFFPSIFFPPSRVGGQAPVCAAQPPRPAAGVPYAPDAPKNPAGRECNPPSAPPAHGGAGSVPPRAV